MQLITKQSILEGLAQKWKNSFGRKYEESETYKQLVAAAPLTEEKAIEIVGNRRWTDNICDECNTDSQVVIHFGGEPNWDDAPKYSICPDCLQKAIQLIK